MKKKTILIIAILLTVCMIFAGCGSDKSSDSSQDKDSTTQEEQAKDDSSSDSKDVLYSKDGVDIKSVAVERVGKTFNLQVIFANNNDKDATFKTSKFEVKKGDVSIRGNASTAELKAKQSYNQYAFPLLVSDELSVGDKVEVYYDGQLLDKVKVKKF